MTTRGFLVGRFQPFHKGHAQLVETVAAEVDELVLGIGSAGLSHTERNPFTAGERITMVTDAVEALDLGKRTYTIPLQDINRNALWVSHVRAITPRFDVAYSNNPLVVQLFTEAGVEVRQTEMFDRDDLEGTTIRRRIVECEEWERFVPDPVVSTIEEVGGVERLRRVAE